MNKSMKQRAVLFAVMLIIGIGFLIVGFTFPDASYSERINDFLEFHQAGGYLFLFGAAMVGLFGLQEYRKLKKG